MTKLILSLIVLALLVIALVIQLTIGPNYWVVALLWTSLVLTNIDKRL